MKGQRGVQPIGDVLRHIYEGTAAATGDEFFRALVRSTAAAMGTQYAFVSEFAGTRTRVRTIVFWTGKSFGDNFEYDLDGTVCEGVLQGEMGYYPKGVAALFPREEALETMGIESYLAVPMVDRTGDVLGHLAVFDTRPMDYNERELEVFQIFGQRAAAELSRNNALCKLAASEARLSSILDTAMDAIITIDAAHHILLFNSAAERLFHCTAEWALNQPIDRLLSAEFRKILSARMDDAALCRQAVWAPEGLSALRADGESFSIDVTLSPLQVGDQTLFTLILRDVSERDAAKQKIRSLQAEKRSLEETLRRSFGEVELVGDSAAMRNVLEQVEVVAPTGASVLLIGETGTGKEVIARALHAGSPRSSQPFITVNCAALPKELIESELFGHEKGAFTGASAQRKGRFELADKGTLFLDELGELPAEAQAKLLRVLQERTFERVGGSRTLSTDVRVVAATNRDLGAMMAEGTFREDLYYRLNVFPISIPPLRARRSDIPALARHFMAQASRRLGKPLSAIAEHSLQALQQYSWPGNIRELMNVIERAAILSRGPVVEINDSVLAAEPELELLQTTGDSLDAVQRDHIIGILDQCSWQIEGREGAAAVLGLKPSTLRYRMRKLGIDKPAPQRAH
jgi:formate hydrogenlyase transcriptional activator